VNRSTKSFADYSSRLIRAIESIKTEEWDSAAKMLHGAWENQTQVFICGNGGSASTASHLMTDWTKGLFALTGQSMYVNSLGDNQSLMTALGNDFSYEDVFRKQVEMWGKKGDLLVLISGSGMSQNILNVAEYANANSMKVISLTGFNGGELRKFTDIMANVPVENMQITEDIHLSFGHFVLEYIYRIWLENGSKVD
jgi:D-sedoheptulose 7-phosphate isomerase